MKTSVHPGIFRRSFVHFFESLPAIMPALIMGGILLASFTKAQQMPQDNWRLGTTQFGSPTDNNLRSIAVGNGSVYVGEFNGSNVTRVLQFTEAGTFVRRFSHLFGNIFGIACDSTGNVYVLARGETRVKVFTSEGTYLREWGRWGREDGEFDLDTASGNTLLAISKNNEVYVCDVGNACIQVFSTAGTFLKRWGQAGTLPGQFQPGGPSAITVTPQGRVLVGTSNHHTTWSPNLKIFDTNGTYLVGVNPLGSNNPYGTIAICSSRDGLVGYNHYPGETHKIAYALDPAEGYSSVASIPTAGSYEGGAFSARGDYYCIKSNRVSVSYREYSNASNFPSAPAIAQPMVLAASQRTGTNWIDVDYQVNDADSATVTTALLAVRDGDSRRRIGYSIPMRTLVESTASNVGANQPTGAPLHVTWNMPADWAVDYTTFEIEALAKDSRNLLGIHWITVPASGGQSAFQVSSAPITEAQFRDLWLWYIATGQVNQTYSNNPSYGWLGTVYGKTGVWTGVKLVEEAWVQNEVRIIGNAGRAFAFEQMEARSIDSTEIARAQAGQYGFSSVDAYSIVKLSGPTTSYLKGWGYNGYGQAAWQSFSAPNISSIAAGHYTTFYIRADGALWGVGYNNYGQLGDGTTTDRTGPLQITTGVSQVSTSGRHTMFIKTDGTLWAMGLNGYGQLGDTTTTNRVTPVQVASGVSQVSCGWQHTLFVKTDGSLYAMGYNAQGQLGDTTIINRSTPVLVATGVAQASGGTDSSAFVKTDGKLFTMGFNNYGQLGDTTTTNRSTPVQVATGVAQVCAGRGDDYGHTVFVKTNGELWAVGRNNYGQLGDGTTTNSSTPIPITTGVTRALASSYHTVFLKSDNTVWSMGRNDYGQLGDGTTTNRNTPAQFDVNSAGIAIGGLHSLSITLP